VGQGVALDKARLEAKAAEASRAELAVVLAQERGTAEGRKRAAEADAAALREERAKTQRLEDDNKVRARVLSFGGRALLVPERALSAARRRTPR
jgi:hypothetical protein